MEKLLKMCQPSYSDFERVLKENKQENIPIKQLQELMVLISNQMGYWESEWFFSPQHTPNEIAKSEIEGWEKIWETCFTKIVESVPNISELIITQHNLTKLQYSLSRRVKFNKLKPLEKFSTYVLSKVAFFMNNLGLHGAAERIYTASLYPKGTMGRA